MNSLTRADLIHFMKKSNKRNLILWGSLSLLMLIVIYGQSMMPPKESGALSGFAVTYLKPVLDPFGVFEAEAFHHFIRKAGHFSEYACFSLFFGNFCRSIGNLPGNNWQLLSLFVCLAVAVSDEFLQSFTGRGSSVRDVVLDFSGALLGFCTVWLWSRLSRNKGE